MRVHDSQAYRKVDVTRERIGRISHVIKIGVGEHIGNILILDGERIVTVPRSLPTFCGSTMSSTAYCSAPAWVQANSTPRVLPDA